MSGRTRRLALAATLLVFALGADLEQPPLHPVSQKGKTFLPGNLTVRVGEEVVFLNDDDISHNVFSRSQGAKFNLKLQKPGEHKRIVFEQPGEVVVRCAIHPKMKMTIEVEE